jgi:hypothetical protein
METLNIQADIVYLEEIILCCIFNPDRPCV